MADTTLRYVQFSMTHPGCPLWDVSRKTSLTLNFLSMSFAPIEKVSRTIAFVHASSTHDFKDAIEALRKYPQIGLFTLQKTSPTSGIILTDRTFDHDTKSINRILKDNSCLPLYPVVIGRGIEAWTAVAHHNVKVKSLKEAIANAGEIKYFKTEAMSLGDFRIGNGLTKKQLECLLEAYSRGYFDWPRRATAEEVAKGLHISSATFFEHMRKAQQQLIQRILVERMAVAAHLANATTSALRPEAAILQASFSDPLVGMIPTS